MPGKGKGKGHRNIIQRVTTETMIFERWEGRLAAGEVVQYTLENTLENAKLLAALNWGWPLDADTVLNFVVFDPSDSFTTVHGRPWQPNLAYEAPAPTLQGEWAFQAVNLSDRAVDYNIWVRFS